MGAITGIIVYHNGQCLKNSTPEYFSMANIMLNKNKISQNITLADFVISFSSLCSGGLVILLKDQCSGSFYPPGYTQYRAWHLWLPAIRFWKIPCGVYH